MAVTDEAIAKIRALIIDGTLKPGHKLPQENELASQLGISRNSTREAVRALEQAKVLSVRHGSGTYVTSLEPSLLLEGISLAVDMLQDDTLMEVIEIRQLLEPAATRMAARRMTAEKLAVIVDTHEQLKAQTTIEDLVQWDMAFHRAIIDAADNATLSSILDGLSSRTARLRIWAGVMSDNAVDKTVEYHEQIVIALQAGDPVLAEAVALLHVTHARRWLDAYVADGAAAEVV